MKYLLYHGRLAGKPSHFAGLSSPPMRQLTGFSEAYIALHGSQTFLPSSLPLTPESDPERQRDEL